MRQRYSHIILGLLLLLSLLIVVSYSTNKANKQTDKTQAQTSQPQSPKATVVASNFDIPWAVAFLPDGAMLITERPGKVKHLPKGSQQATQVAAINEVKHSGEGGLLGIAVHPQFSTNSFVYVYYTYGGNGNNTQNRVARYTFANNQFTSPTTIVDAIPGASNHNGGRIKFGPDGFLYITTGDAAEPSRSQDKNSLAGKILRVTDAGQPAPGNPFNNRTYSYGHRNPQGLAWNGSTLYATEHGQSFKDEVNKIDVGKNYGWPTIEGDEKQAGLESPLAHSGSNSWAPSGTAFFNGSVFFAGLRGTALFEAVPQGNTATIKSHFKGELGRIREAIVGPDNQLYITTTNRDGRGSPKGDDDKIYRVSFGTASPNNGGVNPTFGALGPCPSCTDQVPSPVGSVVPNPGTSDPLINSPSPITDPCETSTENVSLANNKHDDDDDDSDDRKKHWKHEGAVSGIVEAMLRFLTEFLNLILKFFGGGQINLPNQDGGGGDQQPCDEANIPNAVPSESLIPSEPVMLPSGT